MTSQQIRQTLGQPYQFSNWKRLLHALFPERDFLTRPVQKALLTVEQQKTAEEISQFGQVKLADNSLIGFYIVELKKGGSISKNRVGLRNLISSDVIPGSLDGIIAVYHASDATEWRMSFISKQAYWDEEGKELKEETQPRRYTYVFGPEESCETAIERFTILLQQAQGLRIEHLLQAFSVEKISGEFFKQYHQHFKSLTEYLEQSPHRAKFEAYFAEEPDTHTELTNRAIRNFVKKLLGRLVFLYFLQKKGWMGATTEDWRDGRRAFIYDLFEACPAPDEFYRTVLTELFFNTLNNPHRPGFEFLIDGQTPFSGGVVTKVPYLNGGLFEKDSHEPIDLGFKAADFRALLDFFGSYNFTIDENLPADQDVGVDPETLGLIFENLIEDNKDKGTFYTPKEVVHYMCRESLSLYLQRKLQGTLSPGELRVVDAFIKGERSLIPSVVTRQADAIYNALDTVRICDPAIGSGAFPMGLVLVLFDLKRLLSGLRARPHNFSPHTEKLRIIRENIYGVDLDKGAIDIARLRFWLSLIVDEEKPSPLPNLDYKIMQGDSLTESFEGIELDNVIDREKQESSWNVREAKLIQGTLFELGEADKIEIDVGEEEKQELRELKNRYFESEGEEKKLIREKIDSKIHNFLHNAIDKKIHELLLDVAENKKSIIGDFTLYFKSNSKLPAAVFRQLAVAHYKEEAFQALLALFIEKTSEKAVIRKKVEKQLKEIGKLQKRIEVVQAKEDNLHRIAEKADEKPYFLWHFFFDEILTGEADAGFDIVIGNPPYGVKVSDELTKHYGLTWNDSYGTFMSMALRKLLRPGGVLCYIVSDTWLTIKSHLPLRKMLLEQRLHKVIRLHPDCFKAVVNSCIFTLTRPPLAVARAATPKPAEIIVADLTNISTRRQVPQFRELIFNLETFAGEATPDYAVYAYPQSLIATNSHLPIFVASPKLFGLMNDSTAASQKHALNPEEPEKTITLRIIDMNDKTLSLVKFGEIAEVRQGLATGDNDYYIFQNPEARGSYKNIREYSQYLLTDEDLGRIKTNEELRLKIIDKGLHQSVSEANFDPDRYFGGRFILRYDKGGESDAGQGWLPNYYVPTDYFIDWSSISIERLRSYTIAQRIIDKNERKIIKPHYYNTKAAIIRSPKSYLKPGITFSRTGQYSPSFRINSTTIFDTEGSTLFLNIKNTELILGVLNSKLIKYLLKNFVGHSVHTQVDELKELVIPNENETVEIQTLVSQIITKQKQNPRYDYQSYEQREIDRLVYELYGINEADIQEVERWYARRYPKLLDYAYVTPDEAELYVDHSALSVETAELLARLEKHENKHVEFKSTLLYDIKQDGETYVVKHSVLKTLAAFANAEGGNLLIGVTDEGPIYGLTKDYEVLGVASATPSNQHDAFGQRLDALIQEAFGDAFQALLDVAFTTLHGQEVCVVSVKPSSVPYLLYNSEKKSHQFYIRRLSSSVELTYREQEIYSKNRWK